jgi:hypothetical protein
MVLQLIIVMLLDSWEEYRYKENASFYRKWVAGHTGKLFEVFRITKSISGVRCAYINLRSPEREEIDIRIFEGHANFTYGLDQLLNQTVEIIYHENPAMQSEGENPEKWPAYWFKMVPVSIEQDSKQSLAAAKAEAA